MLLQGAGRVQHLGLLLRPAGGEQDVLLRDALAHGEHGGQQRAARVVAQAAHLSGGSHVDAQYGVGLLQAVERELAGLDAHIIEIEQALVRLLHWNAEHDLRGQLDEVDLKHLAHEREAARGTEVALDDLDVIILGQELDVEGAADSKFAGNLTGNLLDAAHRLHIEFLRGELDGGIARMHAGELDMLADGIGDNLAVTRHGIHFHLLGVLQELADDNRVFMRYIRR